MRKWPQNKNVGEIRIGVYSTSPLTSKALKDYQFDHRSLCGHKPTFGLYILSMCINTMFPFSHFYTCSHVSSTVIEAP